jgi:hypothetical protein
MLPIIPQKANDWLRQPNPNLAVGMFPPNLAATLSLDIQQKVVLFMMQKYVWPQVQERRPFECMWKKILDMYRIRLDQHDTTVDENSPTGRDQKETDASGKNAPKVRVADSVVFDAVERLTDLHHFVAFKNGLPIQYNIPKYFDARKEDSFYHPFRDRIKAGNALLQWNADNEEVYRKHLIAARHFYQYGVAFVQSAFNFEVSIVQRMQGMGVVQIPEITAIGTTFEPISIWKLWLNYRLLASEMDYQPCPFMFDLTPRFATLQNQYNPRTNPFGYANLDMVQNLGGQWLFTTEQMQGMREAIQGITHLDDAVQYGTAEMLDPKYSLEAVGTYYPMLPLDPQTGDWEHYQDGTPVPFFRYIVNTFGENLSGHQILLRLQRNFYPRDMLPLYGTSHMPDLDSGLYTPSLGYLLYNHYKEIVTCKEQYLTNKDWINNPPSWVLSSSPAQTQDRNKPGANLVVNGPNDFGWRTPYDGTGSTVNMMQHLREQAQTASKSGDAILGKALGGRTSATEAANAFQASMSAVTTPINIFNFDIMGGFADRVWEYTASWFPPPLLEAITGSMGFAIKPEDLWLRVGLKSDVGSSYIESIVRQQNIRYMLESSMGDPTINRAPMWRELLEEWGFDTANEWINDGGVEREVAIATEQAINTFYGNQVMLNPDQNHQIAIRVKTRFLEDQSSVYMTQYKDKAPLLVQQIQIHQSFVQLQLHQQLLMMKLQGGSPQAGPPAAGAPPLSNANVAANTGQMVQQGGAALA